MKFRKIAIAFAATTAAVLGGASSTMAAPTTAHTAPAAHRATRYYICAVQNTRWCSTPQPASSPTDTSPVYSYDNGLWKWEFTQAGTCHDCFTYGPINTALNGQPIWQIPLAASVGSVNGALLMNNNAGSVNLKTAGTGGSNYFWVYDSSTGWWVNIGRSNSKNNWEVLCDPGNYDQETVTTRTGCARYNTWGNFQA